MASRFTTRYMPRVPLGTRWWSRPQRWAADWLRTPRASMSAWRQRLRRRRRQRRNSEAATPVMMMRAEEAAGPRRRHSDVESPPRPLLQWARRHGGARYQTFGSSADL